jgi:hypothetical protein
MSGENPEEGNYYVIKLSELKLVLKLLVYCREATETTSVLIRKLRNKEEQQDRKATDLKQSSILTTDRREKTEATPKHQHDRASPCRSKRRPHLTPSRCNGGTRPLAAHGCRAPDWQRCHFDAELVERRCCSRKLRSDRSRDARDRRLRRAYVHIREAAGRRTKDMERKRDTANILQQAQSGRRASLQHVAQ